MERPVDVSWLSPGLPIGAGRMASTETSTVHFPYDSSVVATVAQGSVEHAHAALEAALAVRPAVAALPAWRRHAILSTLHASIAERAEQFEELLIAETGKPRVDCQTEVARTLATLRVSAEEATRVTGETVALDAQPSGEGLLGFWSRRPIGVIVAISGFNYPLLLTAHKLAPALAAGCPVICKPAPQAPLAAFWLVELARAALAEHAAPQAAVQLVTGGADVGAALVRDPRVGAVSFTGSATVGHAIARDAAPRKVLLELGSNAALIVAADADLEAAVDAVLRGAFYASGQACISIQRVLLVGAIRPLFVQRLLERIPEVTIGDPRELSTRVSALIDPAATERARASVATAVAEGATLLHGGDVVGSVLQPTVLDDVPDASAVWTEEVFAPIVCLRAVPDLATAFAEANASRYGLHASIFTESLSNALAALDALEVGGVVVNEIPGFRGDSMPYGGVKDSGTGREGPRFAMEEYTVTRMAIIRPSAAAR